MKNYNDRLRDLRNDNDLTQKEVAAYLGIDQRVYSNYEIGIRTKSMLCTHITAFGYGRLSYRCKKL